MEGFPAGCIGFLQVFFSYNNLEPLLFTRVEFWIFFLVLLAGYLFVQKSLSLRNVYLLLFSLLFYYKSCGLFFVLILFSIPFNYGAARIIDALRCRRWRKFTLSIAVAANLLLLVYFKYTAFFFSIINAVFHTQFVARDFIGSAIVSLFGGDPALTDLILPVGISFYTFQAISYIVDVYRRQVQPLRRLADFGFYLSFFPQLVAGPIVRATEFVPQINRPYQVSKREASHALFLILTGLFKKVVLSDYVALNLVDRVFASPQAYTGIENLLATYGYALQIYCDFSGYTDIAIGVALLLGFRLTINFNFPYCAKSLTDFWRRWHISLSSWLRDYLYIPLGGSRHGLVVMWGSLLVTMLLGGLWHGASWNFVIWGGAHGVGLIVSKLIDRLPGALTGNRFFQSFRAVLTFHFVCALWIFFRAQSLPLAQQIFGQIVRYFRPDAILQLFIGYRTVLLLILLGFALHWMPKRWLEAARGAFISAPLLVRFLVTLAAALLLLKVQSAGLQPFIYFDF